MRKVALLLLAFPLCAGAAEPVLRSFEFIGCSGASNNQVQKPEVWRVLNGDKISFLTHHVDSCGLKARGPSAAIRNGKLDLRYELYQPAKDTVMLCDCEYWAKFTFGRDAVSDLSVTFSGQPVKPLGDWPGR